MAHLQMNKTYPKLVLCFFPPEKGSAVLIFINLSDGFSENSPAFDFVSFFFL